MTKEELEIDNKRLDFNEKVQLVVKKEELKEQDIRMNKLCFDYQERERRIAELENKIADIKANCDLAIEGRDIKIMELEQLIEKMRNCVNCRYKHCDTSSVSIDKDGNETFHSWNEEKERYCDTGKNGKYQCWEIKE